MDTSRAYTGREFVKAVNLSALTGWATFTSILFWVEEYTHITLSMAAAYLTIGLLVAGVVTWVAVASVLWIAMRSQIGWIKAAVAGAITMGGFMVLLVWVTNPSGDTYVIELGLVVAGLGALMAVFVQAIVGPGLSVEDRQA